VVSSRRAESLEPDGKLSPTEFLPSFTSLNVRLLSMLRLSSLPRAVAKLAQLPPKRNEVQLVRVYGILTHGQVTRALSVHRASPIERARDRRNFEATASAVVDRAETKDTRPANGAANRNPAWMNNHFNYERHERASASDSDRRSRFIRPSELTIITRHPAEIP